MKKAKSSAVSRLLKTKPTNTSKTLSGSPEPKRTRSTRRSHKQIVAVRSSVVVAKATTQNTAQITTQNRKELPPPPPFDLDASDFRDLDATKGNGKLGHSMLSAVFRFVEPTWRNYIKYVYAEAREGNADALRYLRYWESLTPAEHITHLPEQICEATFIPAWDLGGWVMRQSLKEGDGRFSMCSVFMRDRVLARSAEYAMDSPENYKHAELFLRASGALPQPRSRGPGGPVQFFNMPVASSSSVAGVTSESAAAHPSGLRDMDAEIVDLAKIMQTGEGPMAQYPDDDEDDSEEEDDEDTGGE